MKTPNTTPAASASRHTPEKWACNSAGEVGIADRHGDYSQGHNRGIYVCRTTPELARQIVAEHNALAGLNPEAVKDVVEAAKWVEIYSREHTSNPIVTCEKCEGSGGQFNAHKEACHTCEGEGRVCMSLPSVQGVEDLTAAIDKLSTALAALKGQP